MLNKPNYFICMKKKWNKKHTEILNILKNSGSLISSPKITEMMNTDEFEISERTVRYYLEDMCQNGYINKIGRQGFKITDRGVNEFNSITVIDKVGFLSSKIDKMAYKMTFNPEKMSGTVVINISIVDPIKIRKYIPEFKRIFEHNFAMGKMLALFAPGEQFEGIKIPEDKIGIGTVCSMTINGILLKYGIPVNSIFGGILVIENNKPIGFVDIIMYNGTSMDPLEIFISSGMTDYLGAISSNGNGKVGASFREIPSDSREIVINILKKIKKTHLGNFSLIGTPGRELLKIPVNEGCTGAIIMGGLNPVAVFKELGIHIFSKALSGLIDYNRLFYYSDFNNKLKKQ